MITASYLFKRAIVWYKMKTVKSSTGVSNHASPNSWKGYMQKENFKRPLCTFIKKQKQKQECNVLIVYLKVMQYVT